ncbi:hypothetical protein BH09ACT6_BH09ACT6_15560 [soil metagenome]
MNPAEAESVLALELEVATALELRDNEAEFREDWRIQFAAERVMERIFQAAEAVSPELRERYFGADGVRYLRGIRNRLSHNYLAIDYGIIWDTITVDLPLVQERLAPDAATARAIMAESVGESSGDESAWREAHLRSTRDAE